MGVYDIITILVVIAAVFNYINANYLKLPSTIGLMIQALVLSIVLLLSGNIFPALPEEGMRFLNSINFTEVTLNIMLSFLLFAGALHVDLRELRHQLFPILSMALVGTIISTFVIGTLMYYIMPLIGVPLDYTICLLFGTLISPTDPIAVLAMLKKTKVPKSLEVKIAGESLFNDGIGVVLFLTMLRIVQKGLGEFEPGEAGLLFVEEVFGGVLLGAALGLLGFYALKATDNKYSQVEILITLALVMGGTRLALLLHVSAPLAMVICGLFLGNEGRNPKLADIKGSYVTQFWNLLDEILNAILFILIGLEILVITFEYSFLLAGAIAIAIVLIGRLSGVGIPVLTLRKVHGFQPNTIKILTWGGLRGGISVALALSLPSSLPQKELIVSITYCVVVFSILVQGLTINKVIKGGQEDM